MRVALRSWEAGRRRHLVDGKDGDLWRQLEAVPRTTWVKAHITMKRAIERGFAQKDWEGNQAADRAAGAYAERLRKSPEERRQREKFRRSVTKYQVLIASVEEAVLAAGVVAPPQAWPPPREGADAYGGKWRPAGGPPPRGGRMPTPSRPTQSR